MGDTTLSSQSRRSLTSDPLISNSGQWKITLNNSGFLTKQKSVKRIQLESSMTRTQMSSSKLKVFQVNAFMSRVTRKHRKSVIIFKESWSIREKKNLLESGKIQCRAYPRDQLTSYLMPQVDKKTPPVTINFIQTDHSSTEDHLRIKL